MNRSRTLELAAVATLAAALITGLVVPPDAVQGDLQRIMYVHVPSAGGSESSLSIRVEGVLWSEEDSLYRASAAGEHFEVRLDDEGKAAVTFGDGLRGARLPTGTNNVVARYRTGTGRAGEVAAHSLTALQSRPVGVRDVTNPLPAGGAEDPETRDSARQNAPLRVLTFGRVVSQQDVEDYARDYAGIGKASVMPFLDGEVPHAHVTVAPATGGALGPELLKDLEGAIRDASDKSWLVDAAAYVPRTFGLEARLAIDARRVAGDVLDEARRALTEAFSFSARSLGQPVSAAEAVQALQAVPGVTAVVLDVFGSPDPTTPVMARVLPARLARPGPGGVQPAELLTLDPEDLVLKELGGES